MRGAVGHRHRGRAGRGPPGGDPPFRGRRADRPRAREPRRPLRTRAPLARPGLEPAERLCRGRSVPLSFLAGHRRWSVVGGQTARRGVQQPRDPDRPLPPQRTRLLGRRGAVGGAAGRQPLERARALAELAQPDRCSARRDRPLGRDRRHHLPRRDADRGWRCRSGSSARAGNRPTSITSWGGIGLGHVGFGSDFDGATVPTELGDASGLQRVAEALRDRGYSEPEVAKLAHANWLRVLRESWA